MNPTKIVITTKAGIEREKQRLAKHWEAVSVEKIPAPPRNNTYRVTFKKKLKQ